MPRRSTRNRTTLASGTNDDINPINGNEATTSIEEQNSSAAINDSLKGTDKTKTVDDAAPKKKTTTSNKKSTSPKKKAAATKSDTKNNKKAAEALTNKNGDAPKKRKTKNLAPANDEDADTTTPTSITEEQQQQQQQPEQQEEEEAPKKKAKKAPTHQQWTEITPLIKHWDAAHAMKSTGSYTFTILSWNVAGLRALIKNHPNTLSDLANRYDVDVLCLQETKLQEGHMDDVKLKLKEYFEEKLSGYDGYFGYSMEKKGYSGTAMFIKRRKTVEDGEDGNGKKVDASKNKKKQATLGAFFAPAKKDDETTTSPGAESGENKSSTGDIAISHLRPIKVETTLGLPSHDGEGRFITAEFPLFHLMNVYVPNSGQNLDRLSYRTQQWDSDFLAKVQQLEKETNKPVLWLGDLNVAHNEKDTWNEGAKHLAKSAGTTAEERASFARQLKAGYVDAFRHLHPEGRGHYTYWSQRAGNRAPNKGLRLDYFICSKDLMEDDANGKVRVRDCFMVPEIMGSDHCPIVLVRVHCV
jgi:exodeoxyribonuclease-3